MESQITMAQGLLSRARELRAGVGDHGDAFEQALVSGHVPVELTAQIEQIVALLRSALDRAARELVARSGVSDVPADLAFPVASLGLTKSDFPGLLRQALAAGTDLAPGDRETLELAQWFAEGATPWLAELDAVANATPIDLRVVRVPASLVQAARGDGSQEYRLEATRDGRIGSVLLLQGVDDGKTVDEAVTVVVASIDKDLLTFLDDCLTGVSKTLAKIAC